jgi:hypothetical protein
VGGGVFYLLKLSLPAEGEGGGGVLTTGLEIL